MKKTNFYRYLEEQLQDPRFAARFEGAGEAWDVALQLAALREQAGLSQKGLARRLKTSQQQISRLESPGYEGHSLANLRRVAEVLHARVRVVFEPEEKDTGKRVAEAAPPYRVRRRATARSRESGLVRMAMGMLFRFECSACKYSCEVSAGPDCGFEVATETKVCADCKEVIDTVTGHAWDTSEKPSFVSRHHVNKCPICHGNRLAAWTDRTCPKCGGLMRQGDETVLWD